jgi:bifunctional DNA-binding transcriptional regulator/antitoxin component of YhaV-PrlF toxin-antitoxin module
MKNLLVIIIVVFFVTSCRLFSFNEIKQTANNNSTIKSTPNVEPLPEATQTKEKTIILSSADTMSVSLTLNRNGKQTPTNVKNNFGLDDGIRLTVSVVDSGYIYILSRGSDKEAGLLFPNKQIKNNQISAGKNITFPQSGWLFFDEKAGKEILFVIYSKAQSPKFNKEYVETLEKLRSVNNADSFTTEDGELVRVIELKHE